LYLLYTVFITVFSLFILPSLLYYSVRRVRMRVWRPPARLQ
jgi:hypothetical protein